MVSYIIVTHHPPTGKTIRALLVTSLPWKLNTVNASQNHFTFSIHITYRSTLCTHTSQPPSIETCPPLQQVIIWNPHWFQEIGEGAKTKTSWLFQLTLTFYLRRYIIFPFKRLLAQVFRFARIKVAANHSRNITLCSMRLRIKRRSISTIY